MSLLKWQELAKSKTNLGNKINEVRNTITKNSIDEQTSQSSFQKVFKPVTSKLDDVIVSNLKTPPRRKPARKVIGDLEALDYDPEVDPFKEMDVEGMIEPPRVKPTPIQLPTYSESQPPAYSESQTTPDFGLFTEDEMGRTRDDDEETLYPGSDEEGVDEETEFEVESEEELKAEDVDLPSLDEVKMELADKKNKKIYLSKITGKANNERNRLKGFKASNTKRFNAKKISEKEFKRNNKIIDDSSIFLSAYINENRKLLETFRKKGSGIRRKIGGNVMFFNDPNKLLKKLEIIIGSKKAGNTSVELRNMGVAILDTLLKMFVINKQQYEKLYKTHFKN